MTGGGGGPSSDGPMPPALKRAFPESDSGRFWWRRINRVFGEERVPDAAEALTLLILEWMPDWSGRHWPEHDGEACRILSPDASAPAYNAGFNGRTPQQTLVRCGLTVPDADWRCPELKPPPLGPRLRHRQPGAATRMRRWTSPHPPCGGPDPE